jgi:hypothetical protein
VKFVFYKKWLIQFQFALPRLVKKFNHHRDFHRAGRMKRNIIVQRIRDVPIQRLESNSDIRPALAYLFFDFSSQV